MLSRSFGNTGLDVSIVGLGAGGLGRRDVTDEQAEALLCGALDAGVTLIDTARSYDLSEERIGKVLAHRRGEFVLATKGGYGAEMADDWTHAAITKGVERALRVLRTDWLDIFLLHSCPRETALRDDIQGALEEVRAAGKVRVVGYSGEGDALGACVEANRFGCVECSVSLFDQRNLESMIPSAASHGLGVIAKRPLANAVWRLPTWPTDEHADYWERMHAMQLSPPDGDWVDTAVRWTVYAPGVCSAIVGTTSLSHLKSAIDAAERGDLPGDVRNQIATAFSAKARDWPGKV